ncbi:MAG: ATP-binding protein [Oligoflexales bacterium]
MDRKNLRILLVEDNEDHQELTCEELINNSISQDNITKVQSIADLGKIASNIEFDCILLDLILPDSLTPESTLEAAIRLQPSTAIIVLTSLVDENMGLKLVHLGAQDYLSKDRIMHEDLGKLILFACERKSLERELQIKNESLSTFSRTVAHDLKTPLNGFIGYLELLQDEEVSSSVDEIHTTLGQLADNMNSLVEDLLRYATLGDVAEEETVFSLNELMEEVESYLSLQLKDSGTQIERHDLPFIRACRSQIKQVFVNLIGNSIKYRSLERQSVVIISTKARGNDLTLELSDNGLGFKPSQKDEIFMPMHRLESTLTSHEGTGLGLAICKKIVESHGGKLRAEGRVGEGATFMLQLDGRVHENLLKLKRAG